MLSLAAYRLTGATQESASRSRSREKRRSFEETDVGRGTELTTATEDRELSTTSGWRAREDASAALRTAPRRGRARPTAVLRQSTAARFIRWHLGCRGAISFLAKPEVALVTAPPREASERPLSHDG